MNKNGFQNRQVEIGPSKTDHFKIVGMGDVARFPTMS